MAKIQRMFTSWSFSRLNDYRQCPAKAKYKHLLKLPEPSNKAMERGNAIHKVAENYIKGLLPPKMPDELSKFADLFKTLRAKYKKKIPAMHVEGSLAFTRAWDETRWDDWDNCWLRIKVDCADHETLTTLDVYDWKTGKVSTSRQEEYVEQLELYALGGLLAFKHIKTVKPKLVYLDHKVVYPTAPADVKKLTFTRKDIPMLTKTWITRTDAMFNDEVFAPRPSDQCRWCHYRKSNGGPCQY